MATYFTLYFKGSTDDAWGYPEPITVTAGFQITLPTHVPARTGYTFSKWTTGIDGAGQSYNPGGYFATRGASGNCDYLYAQWTKNTYTVTYNANGGSGAPSSQTKTYGVKLTLSSTVPTRTNYTFKGWGISKSATTVSYAKGASYTANASITLYAIWEKAYVKPRVTNFKVYRATSSGTNSDSGKYFKITCNWETDLTVSSVVVGWKTASATSWTTSTISSSGTSGSVASTLGSNAISTENSYDVRIVVTDSKGSTTVTGRIPGQAYTIDVYSDGKGIAFGKPSEKTGLFEVEWDAKFNGKVEISDLSAIIDAIYPVNSIYISYSHTSPASLFGGTWARLSPYFLYATGASGVIGETGGETSHTLTIDEMPNHKHTGLYGGSVEWSNHDGYGEESYPSGRLVTTDASSTILPGQISTGYIGGGKAHNNLPPFIKVSVWRRTQ